MCVAQVKGVAKARRCAVRERLHAHSSKETEQQRYHSPMSWAHSFPLCADADRFGRGDRRSISIKSHNPIQFTLVCSRWQPFSLPVSVCLAFAFASRWLSWPPPPCHRPRRPACARAAVATQRPPWASPKWRAECESDRAESWRRTRQAAARAADRARPARGRSTAQTACGRATSALAGRPAHRWPAPRSTGRCRCRSVVRLLPMTIAEADSEASRATHASDSVP